MALTISGLRGNLTAMSFQSTARGAALERKVCGP
jgi:hypothetical protein